MTGAPQTRLRIFPATPRNHEPTSHIDNIMRVARFSEINGFEGPLLFTGNDIAVEPWTMAQHILSQTTKISPLIAVNPVYMHPFTVARLVSSFAQLYGRKVYLNMVTGTATSDLSAIGEQHSHEDRYLRLGEFISIVRKLLVSARPISFNGKFYSLRNLQLRPSFPVALLPEFLIAGQSDDALRVSSEMGCLAMQMLPPTLEDGLSNAPGVNMGIVARQERDQAWRAAHVLFQDSAENRDVLKYTMSNTDSVWKRRLGAEAEIEELRENGYWLGPFMNYQADCPYLVGSYSDVGSSLRRFVEKKISTIILDVIADEEELQHVSRTLASSGI